MKNILILFFVCILGACAHDRIEITNDERFVFVEYAWTHRPGTGPAGFQESLAANEGWIMLPNEANGGIYNLRHYYAEIYSREQCEKHLVEKLKDEQFKKPDDCSDQSSTCFTIIGNKVVGAGYLDMGSIFHCIPYDSWNSLKPLAEDKCYASDDVYQLDDEVPCPDYILEKNKDIYKSPSAWGAIKKCADYKEDSLFVCETEQP